MNHYYTSRPSSYMYMLGGVAIGMLAMYLLDPEQGNRRRALIRDKAYSAARTARKRADARSRDLANRARGMATELRRTVHEATSTVAGSTQTPNGPA
ncbi:YtxH domain-containing protein [Massilia horti]|uniref:YtxH domain-containing protein n=1 Tax=Massilia horti TaxID=2562153 RepID=A0A4Y9T188_9BURK|nr:YtxH domain-containing protein [Massilia horti]TFW31645.1 YtxH domain-containing protein [Massilia horti]